MGTASVSFKLYPCVYKGYSLDQSNFSARKGGRVLMHILFNCRTCIMDEAGLALKQLFGEKAWFNLIP